MRLPFRTLIHMTARLPECGYRIRVHAESGENGAELLHHRGGREGWPCCGWLDSPRSGGVFYARRLRLAAAVVALAPACGRRCPMLVLVAIAQRATAAVAVVSTPTSRCWCRVIVLLAIS